MLKQAVFTVWRHLAFPWALVLSLKRCSYFSCDIFSFNNKYFKNNYFLTIALSLLIFFSFFIIRGLDSMNNIIHEKGFPGIYFPFGRATSYPFNFFDQWWFRIYLTNRSSSKSYYRRSYLKLKFVSTYIEIKIFLHLNRFFCWTSTFRKAESWRNTQKRTVRFPGLETAHSSFLHLNWDILLQHLFSGGLENCHWVWK